MMATCYCLVKVEIPGRVFGQVPDQRGLADGGNPTIRCGHGTRPPLSIARPFAAWATNNRAEMQT